ncbi:uncharacterized protein LOC113278151 [Papaver somniferum]|uniref:uncharacterized protein LOC113278151 n=1 Tax=Papaver somniferum TaxID=3469 RepID=UPI000E70466E|nr:uncharacterized protein LOC113278151 [Papaver somniferum]
MMDDRVMSSRFLLDPSVAAFKIDTKGEKRSNTELEGGGGCKRFKMRDLRDSGIEAHLSESFVSKETKEQVHSDIVRETSEILNPEIVPKASQAFSTKADTMSLNLRKSSTVVHPLDLNTEAEIADYSAADMVSGHLDPYSQHPLYTKYQKVHNTTVTTSKDLGLNFNALGVSTSAQQNPFYPYQLSDYVKSKDASECGSCTGPLEENDSFRAWKAMKENGFSSSKHGGIPLPKQGIRKAKNDLKRNMEIAKREQVSRFAKIAAPSGLLNGLNPGIINHVRNSKQVHSIIEALVRSERMESGTQSRPASHLERGEQTYYTRKDPETMLDYGATQVCHSKHTDSILEGTHFSTMYQMTSSSDQTYGHDYPDSSERRSCDQTSSFSQLSSHCMDENAQMKLLSSASNGSENMSTVTNEDSEEDHASEFSLSVKAANVASQWLDLLSLDIKGRLAALRRSKKRVQAVVQTELPFLFSREFSSNEENDPSSHMHRARWSAIFDQMDKTLSEEANHLESGLNQIRQMQLHCDQGLRCVNLYGMELLGRSNIEHRVKKEKMAVRAAAASVYSTCNLVMGTENSSSF